MQTAGEATVVRVIDKPDGTKVTIMSNKDTIIEKPGEPKMTRKADGRVIMEDADGRITEHRPKNWRWVKGHADDIGNQRADRLANQGVPR